jgi:hypothetical protein
MILRRAPRQSLVIVHAPSASMRNRNVPSGSVVWPPHRPISVCEERDDHGAHSVDPVRSEQRVNEARAEDHEHGQDAKGDRDAGGHEQRELA